MVMTAKKDGVIAVLKDHIRQDFSAVVYARIAVFLSIAIWLNYRYDFEDDILEVQEGWFKLAGYFVFYGIAYFGTVVLIGQASLFRSRDFLVRSCFILSVLAIDGSHSFVNTIVSLFHPSLSYWMFKVTANLISVFTVLVPVLVFWYIGDRNDESLYGLRPERPKLRPYLLMLLAMLPVITAASFHPSFLRQYPMYKTSAAHIYLGVPEYATAGIYEMAYGLDFVTVELIFRGMMVLGMAHLLGRKAVLAMAVTYCFLHFGKPAGEAISSVFGGYILGVLALGTRSIWGGILLHVGIAWAMELISHLRKL